MFPLSPYAHPVGSFSLPVDIPQVTPGECPFIQVRFNASWLPLILAALNQLILQSTWKGTPDQQLDAMQQATYLQALFAQGLRIPCDTPETPDSNQCGGCDMSCGCIKWVNGVLMQYCCGQWTPVPGMPPGSGSNQPGNGSPQPPNNGGTATYVGCMVNGGTFLVPTLFNTGDVIELTNFTGATNDPDDGTLVWRCYDGNLFIAGACVPFSGNLAPSDPINTINHLRVIGLIGGSYYDLSVGPFTIPSAIVNQPMVIQLNDNYLSNDNGSLCFTVNVTNNQLGSFSHTSDFTISPGGWYAVDNGFGPNAVYAGSTGWESVVDPAVSTDFVCDIETQWVGVSTITSIEVNYTVAQDNGGGGFRGVKVLISGVWTVYGTLSSAAGTFSTIINSTVAGVNGIQIFVDRVHVPDEDCLITSVIFDGVGADPTI